MRAVDLNKGDGERALEAMQAAGCEPWQASWQARRPQPSTPQPTR